MFMTIILFLPFSLLFKIDFTVLKYSFLNLSFISCFFAMSYSNIPRYLYPSSYISLIFSPLGNSIPSVHLTFPLFIVITPHFLISNSIPCLNPLISFSRFSCSFKSSINRKMIIFLSSSQGVSCLCFA